MIESYQNGRGLSSCPIGRDNYFPAILQKVRNFLEFAGDKRLKNGWSHALLGILGAAACSAHFSCFLNSEGVDPKGKVLRSGRAGESVQMVMISARYEVFIFQGASCMK
jgi:hypothetical protein